MKTKHTHPVSARRAKTMRRMLAWGMLFLVLGCVALPEGITPVADFELTRYLGRWYEIARLDHSFERGLVNVTADYSLEEDGRVRVINKGYRPADDEWETAEGVAAFVGATDVGRLKVSFFGPFYGGYNIIALDKANYGYALVCGPSRSYLWVLAREPRLDPAVTEDLVARARALGFATEQLIMVEQGAVDRLPRSDG
jgi:apolipoprotein D and lipocalin family protein